MIKSFFLTTLLSTILISSAYSQEKYRTMSKHEDIKSVMVKLNNDWRFDPVLNINSSDYIAISFDDLSEEPFYNLKYRIKLCNADWTLNTELNEVDYLTGFNDNPLNEYSLSVNTTVSYNHYSLQIPNNDVKPKLPSNYVLEVYNDENGYDEVLLTACFSLLDDQVKIVPEITTATLVDNNNEHHQLSFDLEYKMNIQNVKNDLKVVVQQNNRLDNEVTNLVPSHVLPSKLRFINDKKLIFKAGNEYLRFDLSSYKNRGKNIASIKYQAPYYHFYVTPIRYNETTSYSYDQDQNGRVIYHMNDNGNPNIEGDYFYVHFTIHADEPINNDIYINGDFNYNLFNTNNKMIYSPENKEYNQTLLLKQGLYNYQYLTLSSSGKMINLLGDFYETENEYYIKVYYKPKQQKYDALVGYATVASRTK